MFKCAFVVDEANSHVDRDGAYAFTVEEAPSEIWLDHGLVVVLVRCDAAKGVSIAIMEHASMEREPRPDIEVSAGAALQPCAQRVWTDPECPGYAYVDFGGRHLQIKAESEGIVLDVFVDNESDSIWTACVSFDDVLGPADAESGVP